MVHHPTKFKVYDFKTVSVMLSSIDIYKIQRYNPYDLIGFMEPEDVMEMELNCLKCWFLNIYEI